MTVHTTHTTAQRVFVHIPDRYGYHLFGFHLRRILPGYPIPSRYTVHRNKANDQEQSIDLVMTNGGRPVDTEGLAKHISSLQIFGPVQVGVFGTEEISIP